MTTELLSINQAVAANIERLRKPNWANPLDHLKVTVIDGRLAPWVKLYSPSNKPVNGRDPQDILILQFDCDEACYLPYTGALPDSEQYKQAEQVKIKLWEMSS